MQGNQRSQNFSAIKTKEIILQDADGRFPLKNQVLQMGDSKGTVIQSRDLNLNTIVVNNDNLTIDAQGNITANTLKLTNTDTALTTSGDIVVQNANVLLSGDGDTTGNLETTYVTLLDPVFSDPNTYLWANNANLLWRSEVFDGDEINISDGILNLLVDISGENLVRPTGPNDMEGMYKALTTLLDIFNKKDLFIRLAEKVAVPKLKTATPGTTALSVAFNSPCNVTITITDLVGTPLPDISPFLYFATPNAFSAKYQLTNLCNNINALVNSDGIALKNYIRFSVVTDSSKIRYARLSFTNRDTYGVTFSDTSNIGEAQRFFNQLGFRGKVNAVIVPSSPFKYTKPKSNVVTTDLVGIDNSGPAAFLNNDAPLLAPKFRLEGLADPIITSITIIIIRPVTTKLTAPNALRYYSITLNNKFMYLIEASSESEQTEVLDITDFVSILTPSDNKLSVYSVDDYNQSRKPTTVLFSLATTAASS